MFWDIAIISDLHIRLFKQNELIHPFILKTLDFFYEECKKRKIQKVFILGDFFHVKNIINVTLLNFSLNYFRKKMSEFEHFILVGNHDRIDNQNNFLSIFEKECNVINDYSYFDFEENRFHFLPYFHDEEIKEKIKNFSFKEKNNYLFTHLAINGFDFDTGHEDIYSDLTVDFFSAFDFVFSGHFHSFQKKKNIVYVSSPFQIKHGEVGPNGFIFLNSKNPKDFEFVENIHSPKFFTFYLNKENLEEIKNIENSFLRIILPKQMPMDLIVLENFKNKLLSKNYDIKFISNAEEDEIKEISIPTIQSWEVFINSDVYDIINEFLNNNFFDIDKKKYLEFLK